MTFNFASSSGQAGQYSSAHNTFAGQVGEYSGAQGAESAAQYRPQYNNFPQPLLQSSQLSLEGGVTGNCTVPCFS